MTTTVTIQKWGNSLGLRIPSQVIKSLDVEEGGKMELTLRDREIVLRPKVEQKGTTNQELREHLRSLLIQAKSTGQLHKEIDFGMEGNENI